MRSRNIKPGFFKNEELAECEPLIRILFQGLWCYADKEGRFEWRPKRIKAEILPYDNIDINRYLTVLSRLDFIHKYELNGKQYGQVINFKKHQHPHHTEKDSELPEMTEDNKITVNEPLNNGDNPSDSLIPDSLIPDSLIPDSLIPDSLIPDKKTVAQESSMELKKPKKKSKKPPKNKPKPGVNEFINYYHNSFLEKFGAKPKIDGGKDGKIIKSLLGTYNLDDLKELLDRFFESTDPFILQSGYTIGVFTTQINRLIVGLKVDPETASRFITIQQWEPKDEG